MSTLNFALKEGGISYLLQKGESMDRRESFSRTGRDF